MTPPTKVKLTGGAFQTSEGVVLASGYLELLLNQDGNISGVGQIVSGITIKILLDGAGSILGTSGFTLSAATSAGVYTGTVSGGDNNDYAGLTFVVTGFTASAGANNGTFTCTASTATTLTLANGSAVNETHSGTATASQAIWGNDQMLPMNSYYRVTGFSAEGQPVFGPNNQQVNGSGGTFDTGTWVPNQVISWTPPLQPLEVQTNGVDNSTQKLLNLVGAGGATVVESGGTATITAGNPILLQTDGTNNGSQALLNLISGDNVIAIDGGTGGINISAVPFPTADENAITIIPGEVLIVGTPALIPSSQGGQIANPVWSPVPFFISSALGLFAIWQASDSTTTLVQTGAMGYTASQAIALASAYTAAASVGGLTFTTTASSSSSAGCDTAGASNTPFQAVTRAKFRIQLGQTTTTRMWIGFLAPTVTNAAMRSDNPNVAFTGFWYSTSAGHTKWQCVTQTDAAHSTVVPESTASHVNTGFHDFELYWDGSNSEIVFLIDGIEVGRLVAGTAPSDTTPLIPTFQIDPAGINTTVSFNWLYNSVFGKMT